MTVKFAHTNIVTRDWKKLAHFYMEVFGCKPLHPERDHSGEWLNWLTNLDHVRIQGIHLQLPGYDDGPTLELFQYNRLEKDSPPAVNKPGLAHISFLVDHVDYYLEKALDHGGGRVGERVQKEIEGVGVLTVVYAKDPEGNIVEIQSWD